MDITVNVPDCEYAMLCEIAQKMRLPVKTLVQQELDHAIEGISVWIQRASE